MGTAKFGWPVIAGAIAATALLAGTIAYFIGAQTGGPTAAVAPPPVSTLTPVSAAGSPAGDPNSPRIIVIDRNVILRVSSAGKVMMADMQRLSTQADNEFKAQADALQREANQLQQQLAILAPDIRAQREEEFNNKQVTLQNRITDRQSQIQNGFAIAGQKLDEALAPILQEIMIQRGANLLLDRSAVILASIDVDVTAAAIERLDQTLPTVRVELSRTPPAPPAATAQN